jgi:hypothetical protein
MEKEERSRKKRGCVQTVKNAHCLIKFIYNNLLNEKKKQRREKKENV